MAKGLEGKLALVTGASRLNGIGAAICKELASKGVDIFFTYWTDYDKKMSWGVEDNEPEILEKIIKKFGVECKRKEVDLSLVENISFLFNHVIDNMGLPSILINNACYSTSTSYRTIEADELDKHYKINIRATTLLSSYFAREFNGAEGCRIINISSGQFKGAMRNELAYATTKGGVDALTITLAGELAEQGITCNAINPGPTDTGWMNDNLKKDLLKEFPTGRLGKPVDAAKLVVFLASDEAAWVTGQIIHSAGGFYL